MNTEQKCFVVVRVEFPVGTSDDYAVKLADQLVQFGGALGDVYIVDEGIANATEPEDS